VTVKAVPEHADIYLAGKKIGTAPGPVVLPRGTEKLKLELRAEGFLAGDVEVEPTETTVVQVKLARPQPAGPRGGHGPGTGSGRPSGVNNELEAPTF
jgi:hypothetical protein